MKAALIEPHEKRGLGEQGVLFEPYFQNLIQEFCVGTYSVLEGLGAAHWLDQNEDDGALAPRIGRLQWEPILSATYDPDGERGLAALAVGTAGLRNRLHQDRLGARDTRAPMRLQNRRCVSFYLAEANSCRSGRT